MAKRGKHQKPGVVKCEIITLLADKEMMTHELIRALRDNLNLVQQRGIREHLSKLETEGLIVSDKDSHILAMGGATKGEMKKELIYSLPKEFRGTFRILVFAEDVDKRFQAGNYLKKFIASPHFGRLSRELMDSFLDVLNEAEQGKVESLFRMWVEDLDDIAWDETLYENYIHLYLRFEESPRDLVELLNNMALTFPNTSKFLVSALSFIEESSETQSKIRNIENEVDQSTIGLYHHFKENGENAGESDDETYVKDEQGKQESGKSNEMSRKSLRNRDKKIVEEMESQGQKFDNFIDFIFPDPYATRVRRDLKDTNSSILFLMSVMTNMIGRMDRFDAIVPDFLLNKGVFPGYMTPEIIEALGNVSWEIEDDIPHNQTTRMATS